jgi:alginate O-acetyltransferase complex protein AlgI
MTFVIWGAYHGVLLTIERLLKTIGGWSPQGVFGAGLTIVLVTIGWVPFRATSVAEALDFAGSMFGLRSPDVVFYPLSYYLAPANLTYLILGLLVALFPIEQLTLRVGEEGAAAMRYAGALMTFAVAVIMLSANSFRPFIYFQF